MNAEKYGLERIYFGGCFIRGAWPPRGLFLPMLASHHNPFLTRLAT